MHRWFIGIGLVALALTLLFQPSSGIFLQRVLIGQFGIPSLPPETELALQITSLKSELAERAAGEVAAEALPPNVLPALVYSRYPFNFRNEFMIAAGKNKGVAPGRAVVVAGRRTDGKPVLLGKVLAVYDTSALVRTVFDPSFQLPVRVGTVAADALFVGGPEPHLTLIPKRSAVEEGDAVYSVAEGLPYGLPLGTLGSVVLAENQIFKEAPAVFPYDLNDILMVGVLTE